MALTKEKKGGLIKEYKIHEKDTGSAEVQIALITERINSLSKHFESHKKDHHSRRGLLRLVSQRKKLLDFLKKEDDTRYKNIIDKLNLRK